MQCINKVRNCFVRILPDAIPVSNGYFGTGDGLVHFGSVQCNGTEERLMECEREPNTRCTHILDAGVICQGNTVCQGRTWSSGWS